MITIDQIAAIYKDRKDAAGKVHSRMREVRDAYNGDVVVPLPELEQNEKVAVANLLSMGIDQLADRIASTVPDPVYPVRRPGISTEEKRARDKRQATLGWWDLSTMDLKLYRRARHLVGYGLSPVLIRPDFDLDAPRWEIKDPLGTYPGATADPDDPCVPDCIFSVKRSYKWLKDHYPDHAAVIAKPRDCPPDAMFEVIDWIDDDEIVTVLVGQDHDSRYGITTPTQGSPYLELHRLPNRAGCCTAVVPGRINLDRPRGQFDGMVGMYEAQARLFALEMIAVEQGIWPDEYLVARPNENANIVQVADGRKGVVGKVEGGDFRQIQSSPSYLAYQTVDRLERAQRLTGGIPAEFGGESQNNIRTGRRGENILSATIDFGILQAQRVLTISMEAENRAAIAVDKGYLDHPKSFYVTWHRAKGQIDYTPSKLFDSDQNTVSYAQAGADANGIAIGGLQRVGAGTMSKFTYMQRDPLIEDPEFEHDQVVYEALEAAYLSGVQQRASTGELPDVDLIRVMELVRSNKADLVQAVQMAQQEAQERQAAQAPMGAPEAMPGMSMPGMGVEAQPRQAPTPEGLADLLRNLRGAQRLSPAEQPRPQAVV